jgi:glycosyltransferase involved in cell wall biosynthesis
MLFKQWYRFWISVFRLPQYRLAFVSHDARKHGSELLALDLLASLLKEYSHKSIVVFLMDGGELEAEFRKYNCIRVSPFKKIIWRLLGRLLNKECKVVFNTVASPLMSEYFVGKQRHCLALIHELPSLTRYFGLEGGARMAMALDDVVFPSAFVRDQFIKTFGRGSAKTHVFPQGVRRFRDGESDSLPLKKELGLNENTYLVGNFAASGGLRKAPDIFVMAALNFFMKHPEADVHFLWMGPVDPDLKFWLTHDLEQAGLSERIHFLPYCENPLGFCKEIDCLLLTSREDAFPSTVMEAYSFHKPIVLFNKGNGYKGTDSRQLHFVEYLDINGIASVILDLYNRRPVFSNEPSPWEDIQNYTGKITRILNSPVQK